MMLSFMSNDFDNCHQDFNVAADDYVTFVTYGYGTATLFWHFFI